MKAHIATHLSITPSLIFTFIFFSLLLYIPLSGQDFPYPQSPENRSIISISSPTLQWKGSGEFLSYTLEIFEAEYVSGSNFNSLNLQDYELKYAYEGKAGYEASGLTYHELRNNVFVTIDDQSSGIYSYNNIFNLTGRVDVSALDGNQHEGITYLYNDYFASIEEISNQLVFAKFNYTSTNVLSSVDLLNKIKLSSNNSQNKGYEGITYNPINNKMYINKEKDPVALYEFDTPVAPNFNQPVSLSQPFVLQNANWAPEDLAGLYHLSLNKHMSATKTGEHLLLLSEESSLLLEIDLKGNLISKYEMDIDDLPNIDNNDFFKAEGVTYSNGVIWVASEGYFQTPAFYYGFANPNHQNPDIVNEQMVYQKENISSTTYKLEDCILKNNTSYCWKVSAKKSDGTIVESAYYNFTTQLQVFGCTDENACNFDACATQSDNSCKFDDCFGICGGNYQPGSNCSDGISSTIDDYLNDDCVCVGRGCTDINACNYNPNAKEDNGTCLKNDCKEVCGGNGISGTLCTINSFNDGIFDANCTCQLKGCKDPYACNYNPDAKLSDNSCKYMNNLGICNCETDVFHKALNSKYKQSFSAQNELESAINIYNSRDITYQAGKSVVLNSGFEINSNAKLTLQIKQCSP